MVYLTQNIQNKSTVVSLIQHAFPEREYESHQALTEGYFNIAYEVLFHDGSKSILKIAPDPKVKVMTYEKNIMEAEVGAMHLAAHHTTVPLPEVEFYDPSCTRCSAPYFFMKKIKGKSLSSQRSLLSPQQIENINFQVGVHNKEINQMTSLFFGYPSQKKLQGKNWYDTFSILIKSVLLDAEKEKIDLTISSFDLLALLDKDKKIFERIITPRFVHWDIWEGNIFVEDGILTGFIDWERCLWGDPLMEVGFRSYAQSRDFLRGYGIEEFSDEEKRRIYWYDLYLLMIVAQEHVYRRYETNDSYHWATDMLRKIFKELREM